jgi:hypothetical protein
MSSILRNQPNLAGFHPRCRKGGITTPAALDPDQTPKDSLSR